MKWFLVAISMVLTAGVAQAQPPAGILYQPDPDSPIGVRNPDGPAQLEEFDFLIGDWEVVIDIRTSDDNTIQYTAHWHNRWILNGMMVMQEWRGPYSTGAEFRSWDPQTQSWEGFNIYPGARTDWQATTAQRFEDRMEIYAESEDENGPLLSRETYTDIEPDRMRMYAEVSRDGGETWAPGRYQLVMTRRVE